MTQYFVDGKGEYLGGFDGAEPPEGAIEVPEAPQDARQVWQGDAWGAVPFDVPNSVSARQFKLQLLASNFLEEVEAWIDQQNRAIQIAYQNSGSFVRASPIMQKGFAELGFTTEQVDHFFVQAARL